MAYGAESFDQNNVCQFSTNGITLVPVGTATATSWTYNSTNKYYSTTVTIPSGTTKSDVILFVRPTTLTSPNNVSYWIQGGGTSTTYTLYSSKNYSTDLLWAGPADLTTLEAGGYGLNVYDAASRIIYSTNQKMLAVVGAGSVTMPGSYSPSFFGSTYTQFLSTFYSESVTYNSSKKPYALPLGHGWSGYGSASYVNSTGYSSGGFFSNCCIFGTSTTSTTISAGWNLSYPVYIFSGWTYFGTAKQEHLAVIVGA